MNSLFKIQHSILYASDEMLEELAKLLSVTVECRRESKSKLSLDRIENVVELEEKVSYKLYVLFGEPD